MVRILKPGYGAYVASKAAVEALTKIAAKEMAGRGITANCIAPGPVATDMFFASKDEATIESFKAAAPLARLGTPLDIARLVLFLVSDAGEWVNGQLIQANGGLGIQ
jgi:3-oxoacyl-[acyl-carrier protein] reductase